MAQERTAAQAPGVEVLLLQAERATHLRFHFG